MHLLLTNDDGIHGEGLIRLKEALENRADLKVTVVAPDRERSAASHQITIFDPLILKEVGKNTYTLNGSPADCVKISLEGFLKEKVDMVVSGVNNGPNMGVDVYYSGTVAAAREACFHSIPALAFSLDGYGHEKEFDSAAHYGVKLIDMVLDKTWPEDLLLNVNFPNQALEEVKGIRVTRLGRRVYHDKVIERESPMGWKYFWIGGDLPGFGEKKDSDFEAVSDGFVSVTPLQLDVTAYSLLDTVKSWGFLD